MTNIPTYILKALKQYVLKISSEIPVKKAVLFGSFANGTHGEDSDIDIDIFSDYFENMSRVDGITYLLIQAQEFDLDLQPIAFTAKEYDNRIGVVDEVLKTGIDVQDIMY